MLRIIVITFILLNSINLFAGGFDKYLKSQLRSEIKIQKLVNDEGDYAKALKFSKVALAKYQDSLMIQLYRAKALYLTNELHQAKVLFIKILEKDPTNDIATGFITKIEEQEEANKNKDLESILDYMSDKGFDFLMIFFGFLGAEVLAKRYQECEKYSYIIAIKHYLRNYTDDTNYYKFNRLIFDAKEYLKNFFSICNFMSIIVVFTVSLAFAISVFWFELVGYLGFFLSDDFLKSVSADQLWMHFKVILFSSIFLIYLQKIIASLLEPRATKEDVSYTLEELIANNEYKILREMVYELNRTVSKYEKDKIIEYIIDSDSQEIIKKLFEELK